MKKRVLKGGWMSKSALQKQQRELIQQMLRTTGWSATALAKKAKLAPSTVNKFLKYDVKHALSAETMHKLQKAADMSLAPLDRERMLAAIRAALKILAERKAVPDPTLCAEEILFVYDELAGLSSEDLESKGRDSAERFERIARYVRNNNS